MNRTATHARRPHRPVTLDRLEPRQLMAANTAGIADPTFHGGKPTLLTAALSSDLSFDYAQATAVAPDGHVYVAGIGQTGDGQVVVVARVSAGGNLDTSFGDGGYATSDPLVDPAVSAVVVAPDGGVIVAENDFGPVDPNGGESDFTSYATALRFDPKGAHSPTALNLFGGQYTNQVNALSLQPDGTVYAVGTQADHDLQTGNDEGPRFFALNRFNATTLAPVPSKFTDYRGNESELTAAAPGPNGTLVIAGLTQGKPYVARLKADGSVDPAFTLAESAGDPLRDADRITGVAVGGDGKIVVDSRQFTSGTYPSFVSRLTTAGKDDTSFDHDGYRQVTGGLLDVAVQADGKVVVAGTTTGTDGLDKFTAVRLTPGGATDATFGLFAGGTAQVGARNPSGTVVDSEANALAVDGDGRLVLAGNCEAGPAVARLLPGESPFSGTPITLPGTVPAASYDDGGEGVAYHDADAANDGNLAYRNGTGVDVQTGTVGHYVGYGAAGEWTQYTVTVARAGTYNIAFGIRGPVANGKGFAGGQFHASVDGVNKTGTLTITSTASSFGTVTAKNVALPAGTHVFRVTLDKNAPGTSFAANFASFAVTSTAPPAARLTGTTIGTAGSYHNSGNTAAKATDGSLSTYFDAAAASGAFVGYDLGSAKAVTQVKFAPRAGYAGRMVGGVFQASNSATFSSGVVTVYTVGTAPADGSLTTVTPSTGTAYRYWRYVGPANGYCDLAEFELFG